MKRFCAWILIITLLAALTGCGSSPKKADLTALYADCQAIMPEMSALDENTMLNFLGIDSSLCSQAIAAICVDGMRTDEIWLVEAKDADTLKQLEQLARNRLTAKADETISYAPDQYAVVEKAQVLVEGNYLALIVCPQVEELAELFRNSFK